LWRKVGNDGLFAAEATYEPNLAPLVLARLTSALGASVSATAKESVASPEEIFFYSYAVFHSTGYRTRYGEFLKIDFPRLPLTSSVELFRELCRLGGELISLHPRRDSCPEGTLRPLRPGR
jgi:predicted helicase